MRRSKRLAAALLALALLPGLAACGKEEKAEKTGQTDPGAAAETVYVPEFVTVREGGEAPLSALLVTEEGVYAQAYEKLGEEIPEGVTPQFQDQYAVYGYRLYLIGPGGELRSLDGYCPAAPAEEPEGVRDFSSNASVAALFQRPDGKLLALECVSSSWYEGPEELREGDEGYWDHVADANAYYVGVLEPDGTRFSAAPAEVAEDLYIQRDSVLLDGQGHIVAAYNSRQGDEYGVLALAEDGSLVYQIRTDSYVEGLIRLQDGRAGLLAWNGPEGRALTAIDGENGKLAESIPIPEQIYGAIPGSGAYDLYYTYGLKFYGYSLERDQAEPLLDWVACDVDSSQVEGIRVEEDGTVRALLNTWDTGGPADLVDTELVILRPESAANAPRKEHLTLAVLYLDDSLKDAVIDFNRHSDTCRIDLVYYSEYNTREDGLAGLNRLTTEIMAGKVPDLLAPEELPLDQMAAKGLLEDLYPWLDADGELSRADFYDNVLRAMETEGGLYQACSGFSMITAAGAKSVVGDRSGWTYDELYAALDAMPEGCSIFGPYVTADDILGVCLCVSMEDFIDWESGRCSFDSPAFIQMLEFAKRSPLEPDHTELPEEERISRGEQMLLLSSVYDLNDVQMYEALFGGEGSVSYIGLPTADGSSGSAIYATGLAMSSSCADKEAAWSFLRRLLTEDYQSKNGNGLPTNRAAFEKALEKAATPEYETDEQGRVLLDENGEPIEASRGGMSSSNGLTVYFYALSQAQVRQIRDLVEGSAQSAHINTNVLELVLQEAAAYFSGQKTAEETAKLIQSKLNLYVNEQR